MIFSYFIFPLSAWIPANTLEWVIVRMRSDRVEDESCHKRVLTGFPTYCSRQSNLNAWSSKSPSTKYGPIQLLINSICMVSSQIWRDENEKIFMLRPISWISVGITKPLGYNFYFNFTLSFASLIPFFKIFTYCLVQSTSILILNLLYYMNCTIIPGLQILQLQEEVSRSSLYLNFNFQIYVGTFFLLVCKSSFFL